VTMKIILKASLLFMLTFVFSGVIYAQNSTENRLLKSFRVEKNKKKRFSKLLSLGEYYKEHNIHKADSIRNVLLLKSEYFTIKSKFEALLFSAEISEIQGDQDRYFRDILTLQPLLNKAHSEETKFEVYRHLGFYYSSSQSYIKSRLYLDLALEIAKESRDNKNISETYSSIAYNFMLSNFKDSAFIYTDKSIQFARRSTDKRVLAESFNSQARVYSYFGQNEISFAKNLGSLQLVKGVNDLPKMAKYCREIGKSQLSISNLREAENYFKESIIYSEQIFDNRQIALAYSSLGVVYKERKMYSKAIEFNQKAIDILTTVNDYNGLGEAHNNLGVVYTELLKYDIAAQNFNKALVYYESTNNREQIAEVYHNVGKVFQQQKSYLKALIYLNRSIEIRKLFGSKREIFYTYRILANVYNSIGKTKRSLDYMHLYLDFIDSNTSSKESAKIAELSELYRSEERERFIAIQSDSIERQQQEKRLTSTKLEVTELKNNQKTYIIIGFLIIIVLAGIIGFYRLNQRTIKQQQKDAEMLQTLLRSQMNPHFIFNSMSVIQSYIYDNDIKNSSKFLVNFSRLIRLILENSPKEFIPIATEVEILQKYLETQKLRFEDRFEFSVKVDDQMMSDNAIIPPMITQPFIENAIEHGQLHTIEGGFINILFSKNNSMLEISIEDNGIGRKNSEKNKKSKEHTSMALNITRERIDNLNNKYKTSGYMIVEDYDKVLETGTKVLISLPYQVEANTTKTN